MSSSLVNLQSYRIPLEEFVRATDNFSQNAWLGDGGYGVVYKGQLSDRWQSKIAAIKRVNENSNQQHDDFRNELDMLSYFNHENVNAFIGYCDEGGDMIIAYEFAVNGSLDYLLQDPDRMRFTPWSQRLRFCIGAARGLNYLHTGLPDNKMVIHRNVKSANIVFDHNMEALICGFDLSILCSRDELNTYMDSTPLGTPSYMDPIYTKTWSIKTEIDVYSVGVVFFEILSGMLAYDPRSIQDGEPVPLMNMVRQHHIYGREKLIDPFIRDQIDSSSFKKFMEVAYQCVSLDSDRPSVEVVIGKLEEALVSHELAMSKKVNNGTIGRWAPSMDAALENFTSADDIQVISPTPHPQTKLPSSSTSKKRKFENDDEFTYDEFTSTILSSINNVADAIDSAKDLCKVLKSFRPRVYSEKKIYEKLELMGVSEVEILNAYLFLVEHPEKARALFGCPLHKRMIMLRKMMKALD